MLRKLFLGTVETKSEDNFDAVEYELSLPVSINNMEIVRQEELTVTQFFQVMDLLSKDTKDALSKIKDHSFVNLKIGTDKLISILAISTGKPSGFLMSLKKSEVRQLRDDFFFLNPDLKNELASLLQIAALEMMTSSFVNLEKSLKTSVLNSSKEQSTTSSSQSRGTNSRKSKRRRK